MLKKPQIITLTNVLNSDGSDYEIRLYNSFADKLSSSLSPDKITAKEIIAVFKNIENILKTSKYLNIEKYINHSNKDKCRTGIKRYIFL